MSSLPQCKKIAASTKKQCSFTVSRTGEEFCPRHGGLKKDGSTSGTSSEAPKEKILCGHPTNNGKTTCKRSVKKQGDKCPSHAGKPEVAPKIIDLTPTNDTDESQVWKAMNVAFISAFMVLDTNEVIRSLAEWYLIGANKALDHDLSDEEWAAWINGGCSNASGNSFGETHKHDAMIFLAHLPPMSLYKQFLLGKYEALASSNISGALTMHWQDFVAKK